MRLLHRRPRQTSAITRLDRETIRLLRAMKALLVRTDASEANIGLRYEVWELHELNKTEVRQQLNTGADILLRDEFDAMIEHYDMTSTLETEILGGLGRDGLALIAANHHPGSQIPFCPVWPLTDEQVSDHLNSGHQLVTAAEYCGLVEEFKGVQRASCPTPLARNWSRARMIIERRHERSTSANIGDPEADQPTE